MNAVTELAETVPVEHACESLGVPRGSYYRWLSPEFGPHPKPRPRPAPAWALAPSERDQVLELLNTEFMDETPYTAYATLLDREEYYCSSRTMYRILSDVDAVRERRRQRRHPKRVKPSLVATGPNQIWTWDITKLKGPKKGEFYYLYTILDIYSRYIVGWMVADRESEFLACDFIQTTCRKEKIQRESLTIHSDRGSSMTATTMRALLAELGVTQSLSRPRVPDDNPFVEANYKTLKYRPDYPACFANIEEARAYCRRFFDWYNKIHYHSGIAYMTPLTLHTGGADALLAERQATLDRAYAANPSRFSRGRPKAAAPPREVWINQPALAVAEDEVASPEGEPVVPAARNAPARAHAPDAQTGSTAAEGRAQRSVDAGEHSATGGNWSTQPRAHQELRLPVPIQ